MKVLATLFPLRSHFNMLFGLLSELRRRQHDVRVVCPEIQRSAYASSAIRQLGIEVVDLPTAADGTARAIVPSTSTWLDIIQNPERQLERYRDATESLVATTPRLRSVVDAIQPDVMLLDPALFPAVAVGVAANVPWVAVHSCLSACAPDGIDCPRRIGEQQVAPIRARAFEAYGVEVPRFRYMNVISPHLNLVWHKPSVVGNPGSELHLVGPTMTRPTDDGLIPVDSSFARTGTKLAYVAFGSMANEDVGAYRRVLTACARLGLDVLLSCPDWMAAELVGGRVSRTNDQRAALERAAVHIGYPGAVTFMEAMYYGVPIVSLPLLADHGIQAHFIQAAGVGRAVSYEASIDVLCGAISSTLGDGAVARRAAEVSADYRQGDAVTAAADLVEDLVRRS